MAVFSPLVLLQVGIVNHLEIPTIFCGMSRMGLFWMFVFLFCLCFVFGLCMFCLCCPLSVFVVCVSVFPIPLIIHCVTIVHVQVCFAVHILDGIGQNISLYFLTANIGLIQYQIIFCTDCAMCFINIHVGFTNCPCSLFVNFSFFHTFKNGA